MKDIILPLDAFIRSVGVSRATPHALFLGAGTSITSGMPSAQMCIWEWKRSIFLTNNIGLETQFSELSLSSVRKGIQRWLDRQGIYPLLDSPDEYSVYIESCYPIPESRRSYFQEKVRQAKPHIGYQILGLLASQSIVRSVWTPNFDQLVSRALASTNIVPVEIGIDSSHRVLRAPKAGELLVVALHGDYRYDELKNTKEELQLQEQGLENALVDELRDSPMIVLGYSGRDASLMKAFLRGVSQKGAGTLYWCVQDVNHVSKAVLDLISNARASGRDAYLVPTQGFDDTMVRVSLHCLEGGSQIAATRLIAQNSGGTDVARRAFKIESSNPVGVLKSNAFEIECPSEVLAFDLKEWPREHVWQWIRDQTDGKEVVAVPFKGQIFAFGTIDDIRKCFGENIKERPLRTPISEHNLRFEDGSVTSLMRQALIRSMVAILGLKADKYEVWAPELLKHEIVNGNHFNIYQSVHLSLRQIEKRLFLILKPSVKVLDVNGEVAAREDANPLKLRILGWQHNKEFNDAVNFWRSKLLKSDSQQKAYEYPPGSGTPFRFLIRRSPVFAEIFGGRPDPTINIDPKIVPLLKQRGLQIAEPELVFSNRQGTGGAKDAHPVRGIVNNRPFDFPLTLQGFSPEIRLGIVCPKSETKYLQNYLLQLSRQLSPGPQEADYLPPYPGFRNAFGLNLVVSDPGTPGWIICPEPAGSTEQANSVDVARNIIRSIEMLQASFSPNVVLIFYPDRWAHFRGFDSESEHFDVHDFVKASCVQRGIGTQFLDQNTLNDKLQCRVWWWLSLAFYVKAMRTPWVLEGLDKDSAFVGLGMSVNPNREQGKHIVMGCSHIYSSRGEGLQYRLSHVENPVFFGKNPYLSRDDARRVGEQIRELFFESRSLLPKRVVIHKRTRFTRDEQQGLREGLSGVAQIDMLEIVVDESMRYVASAVDSYGKLHEDNYPVRRGTTVILDDFTALLWVHGVTSAVSNNRRYYQGKRRIPAPLSIRRHAGISDIKDLAEEILGLSKMNWNTFDLYTKLPATVQSSNEIARIGSLLEKFQPRAYDFRLFI
jgi:hypothetical protein